MEKECNYIIVILQFKRAYCFGADYIHSNQNDYDLNLPNGIWIYKSCDIRSSIKRTTRKILVWKRFNSIRYK